MDEKNKNGKGQEQEPVIKEFVHKERPAKESGGKELLEKCRSFVQKYRCELWLLGAALVLLAVVLLGIFLCKVPVITALLVVVLEVVLAVCLCRSPIWLHGAVLLLNIILGVGFHFIIFMLLACLVYLTGIWVLHILQK